MDARDGVLVVVDLDMLLEFAILVPLFNLDNILSPWLVMSQKAKLWSRAYAYDPALLNQAGKLPHAAALILSGSPAPELSGLVVKGDVDGLEGDSVGAQDGLEARGGCDDVGGAGGEGGEDVEGGIVVEGVRHAGDGLGR